MFNSTPNTINEYGQAANWNGGAAFYSQLTQSEKGRRHDIFRLLITALRGDRFVANGEYVELVYDSPKLDSSKNFGHFDADKIWELGICPIPNSKLNVFACEKLAKIYKDLSICDCFYQIDDVWRLDIDEKYSRRGLLLPLRSGKTDLIYGMRAYRFPDDQRPFPVRLRRQNG